MRKCGVEGCCSDRHSKYLHESTSVDFDTSKQQLRADQPAFVPPPSNATQQRADQTNQETCQRRRQRILSGPGMISNGQKRLKVNVMLHPCSSSSYITEAAASELELNGQPVNLTIVGTGGTEVHKQSSRVNLVVGNLEGTFEASLTAHVLDDIASDIPALQWAKLKQKWPHLKDIRFENVARRGVIDVMIGSDHPLNHQVLHEVCGTNPTDPIRRLTSLGWVCFGLTLVK